MNNPIPNCVQVTVLAANIKKIKAKNGLNCPYVTIGLGTEKYKTSVIENTNTPEWNEACDFKIPSKRSDITLNLYHHQKLGTDDFIGQVLIPLSDFEENYEDSKTSWYPLKSKTGKQEIEGLRGELQVQIGFIHKTVEAQSMLDLTLGKMAHKGSSIKNLALTVGQKIKSDISQSQLSLSGNSKNRSENAKSGSIFDLKSGHKLKSKLFPPEPKSHTRSSASSFVFGSLSGNNSLARSTTKPHKRSSPTKGLDNRIMGENYNLITSPHNYIGTGFSPNNTNYQNNSSLVQSTGLGEIASNLSSEFGSLSSVSLGYSDLPPVKEMADNCENQDAEDDTSRISFVSSSAGMQDNLNNRSLTRRISTNSDKTKPSAKDSSYITASSAYNPFTNEQTPSGFPQTPYTSSMMANSSSKPSNVAIVTPSTYNPFSKQDNNFYVNEIANESYGNSNTDSKNLSLQSKDSEEKVPKRSAPATIIKGLFGSNATPATQNANFQKRNNPDDFTPPIIQKDEDHSEFRTPPKPPARSGVERKLGLLHSKGTSASHLPNSKTSNRKVSTQSYNVMPEINESVNDHYLTGTLDRTCKSQSYLQQTDSNFRESLEDDNAKKSNKTSLPAVYGEYMQSLTKDELIRVIREQENQLRAKETHIADLDNYIDGLMVKILLYAPQILEHNPPSIVINNRKSDKNLHQNVSHPKNFKNPTTNSTNTRKSKKFSSFF